MLDWVKNIIAAGVAAACTGAGIALVFIMTFDRSWVHGTLCRTELKEIENLEVNLTSARNETSQCESDKNVPQWRINCYENDHWCWAICKLWLKLMVSRNARSSRTVRNGRPLENWSGRSLGGRIGRLC
jgi:hypothetical protein